MFFRAGHLVSKTRKTLHLPAFAVLTEITSRDQVTSTKMFIALKSISCSLAQYSFEEYFLRRDLAWARLKSRVLNLLLTSYVCYHWYYFLIFRVPNINFYITLTQLLSNFLVYFTTLPTWPSQTGFACSRVKLIHYNNHSKSRTSNRLMAISHTTYTDIFIICVTTIKLSVQWLALKNNERHFNLMLMLNYF